MRRAQRIARIVAPIAIGAIVTVVSACASAQHASNDGWYSLFDGRTLDGWHASENPATFSVANGEIVVHGPRAHLFYEGSVHQHDFRDFELMLDVLTKPGANSGVFIRTAFQTEGWPSNGYEVQVNNTFAQDWRRTGSLYEVRNLRESLPDDKWFTIHTIVRGRRVRIMLDGKQVVDYTEPDTSATRLTGNTIALQGHDPGSEVHYRNIRIRPLSP